MTEQTTVLINACEANKLQDLLLLFVELIHSKDSTLLKISKIITEGIGKTKCNNNQWIIYCYGQMLKDERERIQVKLIAVVTTKHWSICCEHYEKALWQKLIAAKSEATAKIEFEKLFELQWTEHGSTFYFRKKRNCCLSICLAELWEKTGSSWKWRYLVTPTEFKNIAINVGSNSVSNSEEASLLAETNDTQFQTFCLGESVKDNRNCLQESDWLQQANQWNTLRVCFSVKKETEVTFHCPNIWKIYTSYWKQQRLTATLTERPRNWMYPRIKETATLLL